MDCTEARTYLLDRRRGVLPDDVRAALEAHLAGCAACGHEDAADHALSALLEQRLPVRRAPAALKRDLEARFAAAEAPRARRVAAGVARWLGAMAAGAGLAVVVMLAWRAHAPAGVGVGVGESKDSGVGASASGGVGASAGAGMGAG